VTGAERRQATDELDDLDVAPGEPLHGPNDRLERLAPRERHHLAVAQRLVQPARGHVADGAQRVGPGGGLDHAGVGEAEPVAQGGLELLVAPGGVHDADLDDAQVPRLPEHARHVGPGRPEDGGDVVLGPVVQEVQPGRLGQQGGIS